MIARNQRKTLQVLHRGKAGEIPFRLSSLLSRLCRCSNSSAFLRRSVFSVWVKISFTILRQSIPRQSLLSNSLNNDLTSWMLARLCSVIFPLQIEMSRSRSLSSSSSRIICSSKLRCATNADCRLADLQTCRLEDL